jgi:hypothetical protein
MEISYGVPEQDAHLQVLTDQVSGNQYQLSQAANAIAKAMYEQALANDQQLSKAGTAVKRAIRGRINGNNYHLNEIKDQIFNTLAGKVRENNDLLGSAFSHLPTRPSDDPNKPPTYPIAEFGPGGVILSTPDVRTPPTVTQPRPTAAGGPPAPIPFDFPPTIIVNGTRCITVADAEAFVAAHGGRAGGYYIGGPPAWCPSTGAIWFGYPGGTQLPLACLCPSGTQPTPTPAPTPTPTKPQPIGTLTCPVEKPEPILEPCQWYCVEFGTKSKPDLRCLYSNPQSIEQANLTISSGPHATQADCLEVCQKAKECKPPEEEKPPETHLLTPQILRGPTTTAPCALSATGQLPAVGSPEWCGCLDSVTQWTQQISQWLFDALNSGDTTGIKSFLPSFPILNLPLIGEWLDLGLVVTDALSKGGFAVASAWNQIVEPILSLGTQATFLIGVDLARAITKFLGGITIGWDLAIWGTLDIEIAFPWIDKILEYVQNSIWHIRPPSGHEAIDCYLQHTADEGMIRCWMGMESMDLDAFIPVIDARRDKLKTEEVIEYGRRNDIPDNEIAGLLQSQGWFRFNEAMARISLYDELPSIADHLHWLQRNVFDEDYVREFQLDEGFDTRFWPAFGHDLRAKGYTEYRARKDYQAHWINPAPEQLKEMVYRLDPEFTDPSLAFSLEQYSRVLQEQDVGAFFRSRFAAIAYRVPALGYIRDMYRADVFGENQLATYHRQLGYSKADSLNFVEVDRIAKNRYRTSQSAGWTPSAASKANAVGILPNSTHSEIYAFLGFTEDEAAQARARAAADLQHAVYIRARSRALTQIVSNVNSAQSSGLLSTDNAANQLVQAGWPQDFAVSLATSNAVKAQVTRISHAIVRIRHAFDNGEIATDFALASLASLGVLPDAANSYVSVWTLERTPGRKRRTVSQITKDVADGVMGIDEALARFTNLGVPDADRVLLLHDISGQVLKNEQRLATAEQRLVRQRTAELEKAAKQAEATRKAAIAALKREQPVAELKKWAEAGYINEPYFRSRLHLYEFDDPSIDLYVEEIRAKNPSFNGQVPTQQTGTAGQ